MIYTLIFIFCNDEVMLLKRKYDPIANQLTGVGGHIENNETAYECAERELKEEADIETKLKFIGDVPKIKSKLYIGIVKTKPFNIKIMNEGVIKWYNIKEVLNNAELSFAAKRILPYCHNKAKENEKCL